LFIVIEMIGRFLFASAFLLLDGTMLRVSAADLPAAARALWTGGVQPLFDRHCVKCHGPLEQKSGLALDTLESALKGDEIGPVILPGKPEESPMIVALTAGSDPHMPPKKQLAPAEIAQIREWIVQLGATSPGQKPTGGESVTEEVTFLDPTAALEHFIAEGWQRRGIAPAGWCDDRTFVRRLYLDLAGRIPTAAEVETFLYNAAPQKRERLIDRLLASDEYARTFREIWDALLMGRNVGRREQRRRENGWFSFLENAFKENRPWNEVVRAMIVARPEKPEEQGAFWFLYERRNEHQQMAEAIAPVIYGTRVDCAQCHDHPLAREIKQAHYWGLVAAFNRSKNLERRPPAVGESAVGGFVNFTNLKKESQPAVMTMLTGKTIEEPRPAAAGADGKEADPPDGYVDPTAAVKVPKFSRRAALADAVTRDNPLLARAFVNHTWAILLGRGLVHPVDEINSKHPSSHPELLDWLAKDFAEHGYDVKRLVRAIVSSRVYQLAPPDGSTAPPAEAFAVAAEKPLTAETITRSMIIASGAPAQDDTMLRQRFVEIFPDVLPRVQRATIQQAMLLTNSERLATLFAPLEGNHAARIGAMPRAEDRVRDAFRVVLARQPEPDELSESVKYLEAHQGDPGTAVGHLLWVLASGAEFLTNH
jgi:mono/diheme cytochrome c family protein